MTLLNTKKYYSRFLKNHEGKLHFAAHSHHFWPDVTRDAQLTYWDDASKMSDEKWKHIFSNIIPKTQKHIAKILNLKDHEQIALAPNTHEFVTRILSLFIDKNQIKVLTTDSEFHSFSRQIKRLQESEKVILDIVSTEKINLKRSAFINELKIQLNKNPDLFFISQVFFNSGIALTDEEILELVNHADKKTIIVIDGYHGFCAIPTDLSKLEGKIFYLGGGYKYAQAGEGVGFMVAPKGNWRPANTGWFAEYDYLSKAKSELVTYAPNGMSFMGATQDPSGFYRFNAVWDLFQNESIDILKIHSQIQSLQKSFIQNLPATFLTTYKLTPLFSTQLNNHGHFLTFHSSDETLALECEKTLYNQGVIIDRRGCRIRFGFGLYHDQEDIQKLINCLQKLAPQT